MLDYLIIGSGLAGLAVAETLHARGRSFMVFDDDSQRASRVAGGLYNPVVLKRFTLCWEGARLMDFSLPFYRTLESRLGGNFQERVPVLRRLASREEQNTWFEAADRPGLKDYLSPQLIRNGNEGLDAPFGFGEVLHTGRIRTGDLLAAYRGWLQATSRYHAGSFEYPKLVPGVDAVDYKGLQARHVVFCEGFGMHGNPFFNYLPLQGTKGELLLLHIPGLDEERVIKAGVFLIPLGRDRYRLGATYQWNDFSHAPTTAAREQLLAGVRKFLRCDFEVAGQLAGIRPTVPDRRPLVGQHPGHPRLFILNGLGSRGVLLAPYAADCLVRLIEDGVALPGEMDIARYLKHLHPKR